MAISNTKGPFNPDTADVSPGNYIGLSKPIEDFKLSSVLGEAFKGAGSLLEESVKAADALVKASVQQDVTNTIIPERDQYTDALKGASAYVQNVAIKPNTATDSINAGVTTGPIQTDGEPLSLLPDIKELPSDLKNLPQRLDTLSSARGNGKISETDYYGRLTTIAKDIRSKYPTGYRDYIDSEISKVTGVDPANAYIKGLISDINSFMTGKEHERNAVLTDLRQAAAKGMDGAHEAWQNVLTNKWDISQGLSWLNKGKADDYKLEETKKRIEFSEANLKLAVATKTIDAGELYTGIANKQFHALDALPGIGKSMAEINDYMIRVQSGQIEPDPIQMKQLAQVVNAYRTRASNEMDREEARTKLSSVVDPKVLNEKKTAALAPFDTIIKALDSGDMSLAAFTKGLVAAGKDATEYAAFKNKDLAPTLYGFELVRRVAGETGAAEMIKRTFNDGKFEPNMAAFVSKLKIDIASPGNGVTFKNSIETMREAEKKAGTEGLFPQNYQALINMVTGTDGYSLLNSKLPTVAKEELAKKFFSPENRGALREIKPDAYDSKTGRVIPGYQSVFYGFTRPEVVAEINKLSEPTKAMYMDWVRTSVREDLFKEDISKFKTMTLSAGDVWGIKWNTTDKKLEVIRGAGNELNTEPYRGRIPQGRGGPISIVEQTVNSMNKGLDGMANVAKGFGMEGEKIDAFVLQELINAGVGADRVAGIPGIPNAIAEAISSAYKSEKLKNEMTKQKFEDAKKKFEGK